MATARHITKDKGDLAVAKTIAHLCENGIYTCLPLSEHLPFDLIAVMPDMKTMQRFRVGYEYVNLSPYIDQYAVYLPDQSMVRYFNHTEIQETSNLSQLRVEN